MPFKYFRLMANFNGIFPGEQITGKRDASGWAEIKSKSK